MCIKNSEKLLRVFQGIIHKLRTIFRWEGSDAVWHFQTKQIFRVIGWIEISPFAWRHLRMTPKTFIDYPQLPKLMLSDPI